MRLTQVLVEWVLTSALLILIVTALRAVLGKRVGAGLRYALWLMVLVRLLVPVQLFSLPAPAVAVTAPPPLVSVPAMSVGQFVVVEPPSVVVVDYEFDATPVPPPKEEPLSVLQILGWLWLAGSVAMGLAFVVSNVSFARRLRRVREPLEGADCSLPVYLAPNLPSPCLFGLVRPVVYVTPETAADPVMLRHVLAHEHTHYRHGDHVWNVLRSIALAVHWWNPLVWLAVVLSRRDCELACDEGALKRLGDGERVAYGRTLLTLITVKPRPGDLLRCATTMTGGQKSVFERVTRIAHAPKRWLWAAAAVVLVTALACVCAFGQAAEPEVDPADPSPEPSVSAPPALAVAASAEPSPAVSAESTVFMGNRDFEFYCVGRDKLMRFSELAEAVAWSRYTTISLEQYTMVDLDRDGAQELILWVEWQGISYLILHEMNGTLYGYLCGSKAIDCFRTDGTFYDSYVAVGEGMGVGYATMSFTETGYESHPFTYDLSLPSREDGLDHYVLVVDGQPADDQTYSAAVEAQEQKEQVVWQPWEEDGPAEVIRWLENAGVVWLDPVEMPVVTSVQAGEFNWQLTYQGKQVWFAGGEDWYGGGPFPPMLMDLNEDGREEIVFTLVDNDGPPTERLYLFDAETLTQYDTSRTAAMVRSQLSTSNDETYYYLSSPDFGFYQAIPRGLAVEVEDKTRDYLEFSTFVYFPVREDGRLACQLSTPVGKVYGYLGLDGWNVTCVGFEYEEDARMGGQVSYADVLIWGCRLPIRRTGSSRRR